MIFIALILSLIAAFALLRMLRSAGFSQLSTDCTAISAKLEELCTAGLRQLRSARAASFALLAKRALHCAKRFALLALASFALGAASCADMHDEPALSETDNVNYYFTFSLSPENGQKSRGYVEDTYPEPNDVYPAKDPYADGTEYENTVRNIAIFIGNVSNSTAEDAESPEIIHNDNEPFFQLFYYPLQTPVNFLNIENHTYVTQPIPIEAKESGKKAIYVGVNLSQSQCEFIRDRGIDEAYTFPTNSITMVSDITSAANGCAMFCTKPVIFDPSTATPGEVTTKNFSLRRCVAKALVTVKKDNTGKPIVTAKHNGTPTFEVGEVTYIVNSLNTLTYFFQHYQQGKEGKSTTAEKNYVLDPNFDSFVSMQHFRNRINQWEGYKNYFKEALTYDEDRMPTGNNDATCYYEGLYVPENCFNPDIEKEASMSDEDFDDLAEQNVTHVVVRAFITPIVLKVHKSLGTYMTEYTGTGSEAVRAVGERIITEAGAKGDYETFFYTCTGGVLGLSAKEESDLITEASLELEGANGNSSGYSFKSFFTKQREVTPGNPTSTVTDFYCYSAAKIEYMASQNETYTPGVATNPRKLEGFEIYDLGYAHYRVYLDVDLDREDNNQTPEPSPSSTDWRKSQIYRNTYYILTVDAFADVAGGIDPSKKYIEVHTQTISYKPSWNSGVTLNDSDENAEIVNPVNPD